MGWGELSAERLCVWGQRVEGRVSPCTQMLRAWWMQRACESERVDSCACQQAVGRESSSVYGDTHPSVLSGRAQQRNSQWSSGLPHPIGKFSPVLCSGFGHRQGLQCPLSSPPLPSSFSLFSFSFSLLNPLLPSLDESRCGWDSDASLVLPPLCLPTCWLREPPQLLTAWPTSLHRGTAHSRLCVTWGR